MRRAFRHINGAKYRDPVTVYFALDEIDELPGGAPNKVYILCSVNVTRPRAESSHHCSGYLRSFCQGYKRDRNEKLWSLRRSIGELLPVPNPLFFG